MAIETFTYTENFFDVEGTSEAIGPSVNTFVWQGGWFNNDGTKLFCLSSETDASAFEYDLSTPYKPHTATDSGNLINNQALLTNDPPFDSFPTNSGGFMSADGSFMSISAHDGTAFWGIKITFGTAFDLSTAAFNSADVEDLSAELGSSSSRKLLNHANGGQLVFFRADDNSQLLECPLSTPYDILTIGSATTRSVPDGPEAIDTIVGIAFTDDGLTAFVAYLTSSFNKTIIAEYSMSSAFDLTTLAYTGDFIEDTDATGETVGSFVSTPGIFFRRDDLSSMFLVGFDQFETASFNETVFEYSGVVTPPCRLQATVGFKSGGVVRKVEDTVNGLHHLSVGDTCNNIVALVDGSVVDVQVCTGRVTLPRGAARAHFGLPYTTDIETPNIATGDGDEGQGKRKKVTDVTLRMYKSRSPIVGPNFFDMIPMKQRNEEPIGAPTTLLTGDLRVNIPPAWSSNGKISIRQKDPVPLTILAIIPEFDIEDDD